jgi:hypothetical protein
MIRPGLKPRFPSGLRILEARTRKSDGSAWLWWAATGVSYTEQLTTANRFTPPPSMTGVLTIGLASDWRDRLAYSTNTATTATLYYCPFATPTTSYSSVSFAGMDCQLLTIADFEINNTNVIAVYLDAARTQLYYRRHDDDFAVAYPWLTLTEANGVNHLTFSNGRIYVSLSSPTQDYLYTGGTGIELILRESLVINATIAPGALNTTSTTSNAPSDNLVFGLHIIAGTFIITNTGYGSNLYNGGFYPGPTVRSFNTLDYNQGSYGG